VETNSTTPVSENDKVSGDSSKNPTASSMRSKYLSETDHQKIRLEENPSLAELQQKLSDENNEAEDLGPGWQMTNEMIDAMRGSRWLKDEVADSGLQLLIMKIASSSSTSTYSGRTGISRSHLCIPTTTYREQMLSEIQSSYPQFQIFVEKLLYLTGIYMHDSEIQMPVDEWLTNSNHLQYTLKPLSRRVRPGNESLVLPNTMNETQRHSETESDSEGEDDSDSSDS
jgi:hypothetical protein